MTLPRTTVPSSCRLLLKRDGTCAETRFHLSAKQTSPFKSARASVQSTTCSRAVRISSSNAGYTMFRGSVKSTGYPLHPPVSPSLFLPLVTVDHHVSTGLYSCFYLMLSYGYFRNQNLSSCRWRICHIETASCYIRVSARRTVRCVLCLRALFHDTRRYSQGCVL